MTNPIDPTDEIARLRGADPLANADDPELTALRRRVLDAAATEPAVAVRRPRGLMVAGGVAAAVALLAAGTLAGVAIGRATGDEPILALTDQPAEVPAVNTAPDASAPGMPGRGMSMDSALSIEDAKASSMIWPGYSADLIADPGLPDVGGTADGYRLDVSGIDRTALAAQLASVFDVAGSPTTSDGMVTVGDASGMGPQIWVYDDATISWAYSDYSRDPWNCPDSAVSSESGEPGVSEPMPMEPCTPSGEAISEGVARDQAEALLSSLGVSDGAGFGLDWETYTDGVITSATAWQTIEGQRTQLSWSVSFHSEGPLWANGFAGGLEVVRDYPIVGARTAVERSALPRWAAFGPTPIDGGVMPMDTVARSATESTETTPPATDTSADSVVVVWDPAIATGASPTLAQYWTPTGEFLLLPAYRLTTADDRGDWVVIAVAESAVTFTTGR